jgi:plastocyanin
MKKRMTGAGALLAVVLLTLAACGQQTSAANEVSMVAGDFSASSITITAGQAVHFTDPAGLGATHIICLGNEGVCDAGASGPQELALGGFTINAGDAPRDVTFKTQGTYKITCSLHPSMNLTVTVR